MIILKTKEDLKAMRKVGQKASQLLDFIEPFITPGISTQDINDIAVDWIKKNNLKSAVLNYRGFPKSICTSVNNVVCHGIPSAKKKLLDNDIINVDVTVVLNGYYGDTSRTFTVGKTQPNILEFVERVKKALMFGIKSVSSGKPINVIGDTIENYIKDFHYGIVGDLGGHGIGKNFHEDPFILHHHQKTKGVILEKGMVFTIEPMINMGKKEVYTDGKDGWSVITKDHSISAQFEHTIAVTQNGAEILTLS